MGAFEIDHAGILYLKKYLSKPRALFCKIDKVISIGPIHNCALIESTSINKNLQSRERKTTLAQSIST